jgi:hypothetical protein
MQSGRRFPVFEKECSKSIFRIDENSGNGFLQNSQTARHRFPENNSLTDESLHTMVLNSYTLWLPALKVGRQRSHRTPVIKHVLH